MYKLRSGISSLLNRTSGQTLRRFNSLPTVPLVFDEWEPPLVEPHQPTILYIHGVLGSRSFCRPLLQDIAENLWAPLYSVDLRNHGESPRLLPHNYEAMAADVIEFIKQRRFSSPLIIIGFSMGAKVAMAVALQFPDLVSAVVSLDQSPLYVDTPYDFTTFVSGVKRVREARVTQLTDANKAMEPVIKPKIVRDYLLYSFHAHPETGELQSQADEDNVNLSIDSITDFDFHAESVVPSPVPLLVVRGLKSPFVPDECIPAIRNLFPDLHVSSVQNGSHMVMMEQPQPVATETIKFLRQLF